MFPSTDDSHCDGICFCLTPDLCFEDGYMGEQTLAWKENKTPGKRYENGVKHHNQMRSPSGSFRLGIDWKTSNEADVKAIT